MWFFTTPTGTTGPSTLSRDFAKPLKQI